MCGRFALTVDPADLQDAFPEFTFPAQAAPRFNIAPSQPVLALPNDATNKADLFVWGLIPSWAKDLGIGNRMINARAETLAEKPSFRSAFRRRRCLVLADGFYEWRTDSGKSKTPMYIRLEAGTPFAFAGLWEIWNSPDGSQVLSCAIITTEPNPLMAKIHNRMPVILPENSYSLWIQPGEADPKALSELLTPYPAVEMVAYPVSKLVNSPSNDLAACIEPAG